MESGVRTVKKTTHRTLSWSLFILSFIFHVARSSCVDAVDDIEYNNHCYRPIYETMNWMEAEEVCRRYPNTGADLFGHLATFSSFQEEIAVKGILPIGGNDEFWIGYHTIFQFLDDRTVIASDGTRFVKFGDGYNNINSWNLVKDFNNATCYYMDFQQNGEWIPTLCDTEKRFFLCKYPDPDYLEYLDRPHSFDMVYDYEVTYYYRRAKCDFRDHPNLCPDELKYCHGLRYDSNSVCGGIGECLSHDHCECDGNSGMSGPNCQHYTCRGEWGIYACNGRGICKRKDICECEEDFFGGNCEHFHCFGVASFSSDACYSHGECMDVDECLCGEGFYGDDCNIWKCGSMFTNETGVCLHRSWCSDSTFRCDCSKFYVGDRCEISTCFGFRSDNPEVCSGHGSCEKFDKCSCKNSWTGMNCNIPLCFGVPAFNPSVCTGHGKCVSSNYCDCDDTYGDVDCDSPTCFGKGDKEACNGHGWCMWYPEKSKYACKCDNGYYGDECNDYTCYDTCQSNRTVCSGNGGCSGIDFCDCNEIWGGKECTIPKCNGILSDNDYVCSSAGSCLVDHSCECFPFSWRSGVDCEIPVVASFLSRSIPWIFIGVFLLICCSIFSFGFLFVHSSWLLNWTKVLKGSQTSSTKLRPLVFNEKIEKKIIRALKTSLSSDSFSRLMKWSPSPSTLKKWNPSDSPSDDEEIIEDVEEEEEE